MTVLIVAKTRMRGGVCVGSMAPNGDGLRLLPRTAHCQPVDTPFEVGGRWDVEFARSGQTELPHVEDVTLLDSRPMGTVRDVRYQIERHATIWRVPLRDAFEGTLRATGRGGLYVGRSAVPQGSVGFWLADVTLTIARDGGKARFGDSTGPIDVPWVGVGEPPDVINPGDLVRLSLARWWRPDGSDAPERCFLQVSGVY